MNARPEAPPPASLGATDQWTALERAQLRLGALLNVLVLLDVVTGERLPGGTALPLALLGLLLQQRAQLHQTRRILATVMHDLLDGTARR